MPNYTYNGKPVAEQRIIDAAAGFGISVEEYLEQNEGFEVDEVDDLPVEGTVDLQGIEHITQEDFLRKSQGQDVEDDYMLLEDIQDEIIKQNLTVEDNILTLNSAVTSLTAIIISFSFFSFSSIICMTLSSPISIASLYEL